MTSRGGPSEGRRKAEEGGSSVVERRVKRERIMEHEYWFVPNGKVNVSG